MQSGGHAEISQLEILNHCAALPSIFKITDLAGHTQIAYTATCISLAAAWFAFKKKQNSAKNMKNNVL